MDEKEKINPETKEKSQEDSHKELCDYLRNAREQKHISLEKMAKDTRLNLDYLYAIEQGDFDVLPAEVYVRIYIRSMAKYLKIDPAYITEQYAGSDLTEQKKENSRPTGSLKYGRKKSKIKPVFIAIATVVFIAIISFLRTSITDDNKFVGTTTINESSVSSESSDSVGNQSGRIFSIDSTSISEKQNVLDSVQKTSDVQDTLQQKTPIAKTLELMIKCIKDSSWIMVHRDSLDPWRNTLLKDKAVIFKAKKSFQVALGRSFSVEIFLDKKLVALPASRDTIFRFSISNDGLVPLSQKEWFSFLGESSE